MKQHLSNDELLDRMYGLGESGGSHLEECEDCSGRLQALERRRSEVAESFGRNSVSNEFLLAQRRAIYSKLGQAPATRLHWAPAALGVAFLLVTGVFLVRPHAQYRPVLAPVSVPGVELSNEQLFSDLYSMEQSVEPPAAAPIHALFEGSEGQAQQ
ncbi:MAG TPA: hypothetical protein VGG72_03585 [Bryobacteraceae bacterium]|jgi:hypothetical protein